MSKYEPLEHFLKQKASYTSIPMTFAEIEKVIGNALPSSSRRHRAWWSNNPTNNVMTHAWLRAGFETADVDLASEKLTFRRKGGAMPTSPHAPPGPMTPQSSTPAATTPTPIADTSDTDTTNHPVYDHPIFGLFRGMISIQPDYDLTQPTIDPEWLKEKYGE